MLTACAGGQKGPQLTVSGLDPAKFDTTIQGKPVKLYTLKNANGMEVCITNYGGRVVSLCVPDKDGKPTDVVLGFDNIAQYADTINTPSDYGSSVGRYANRIKNAKFTLDETEYQLKRNDGPNCLHGGGNSGWMHQVYEAEQIGDSILKLTIVAADGENGFPGKIMAVTTYKVTSDNMLDMIWEAETTKPTIINQTNHNYYNLSGDFEEKEGGLQQYLTVNADSFTVADDSYMPTGEIRAVEGTTMDLRAEHKIIDGLDREYDQVKNANGGYDHNWCLNTKGDDTQVCATLYSPKTGIFMEMFTNEPGVQVYTGNFQGIGGEENIVRKLGKKYPQYISVCLESQKYPDSPNKYMLPGWEKCNPIVTPEKPYYSHAAYKFSVK